jgi:hypothetical protein
MSDDDNVIPLNPEKITQEFKLTTEFPPLPVGVSGDFDLLLNLRDWLTDAMVAKGAKFTGGGVGCGQADIDITLEGMRYNVTIAPVMDKGENK